MTDSAQSGGSLARGWLLGLGISSLILGGGLAGYWFKSDNALSTERPTRTVQSNQEETSADTDINVEAVRVEQREDGGQLAYRGLSIDNSTPDPKACLSFSRPLDGSRVIDDRAFVRVEPETPVSLEVQGRRLCLLGLDADDSYQVTVLPGFASLDGTELHSAIIDTVAFDPKPPMVGIVGDGIILPRGNRATLGIKAMNADSVDLTLYRVNHRALFQESPNAGETTVEGNWSWNGEAWNSRVEIHSDTIETRGAVNELVEVAYPLEVVVDGLGAGAYIIELERTAPDEQRRVATSWRWLYVTDMALASYRSEDALHVTVRSIETARTQSGVTLSLIARNNEVLAEARSDANGRAEFPGATLRGRDSLAPKMVLAYSGDDDFAALDLTRSPLDLTSYDIGGRDAGGPLDAFLYTERGIYRPGETVHLTALIRDDQANNAFDRDGTLIITKPDGSMFSEQRVSPLDMAGALQEDISIPDGSPRGQWTATLSMDGSDYEGRVRFAVQDFVPEQLRLDVRAPDTVLRLGAAQPLTVQSDFLYGAPGRDLEAEVEVRVQVDPSPFDGFEDYTFGDAVETYREQSFMFAQGRTDEDGRFSTNIELAGSDYQSSSPLRVFTTAGVAEPGGRYVRDSVFIPLRSEDVYVGFDPQFEGGYAPRGREAGINVVAVNADGEPVSANATYTLIREDYDYHWYREDGRWRYRRDRRDIELASGEFDIGGDDPARFAETLDYGQYRLQIDLADGGTFSYQFGSGWRRAGGDADAPDRVSIGLDKSSVEPGGTVRLSLESPFAGEGELLIADAQVRRQMAVKIEEGASEIRLPIARDWTSDLYAMLTVYAPGGEQQARRAVGLVHIPIDRSSQTLTVSLDVPEQVRPNTDLNAVVQVAGLEGESAFLTLAAVDTGILQITDYSPPSPEDHYFGKKAFALDVFDDYSRMLAPFFGPDRMGGDTLGGAGLSVVPTKTVALFSGIVPVQNGRATIPLAIPDFQGELTVMAVAWSETKIGSASTTMVVRDPVTAQLALPRFLAPGDTAVATLALDNVDGQSGDYITQLALNGVEQDEATLSLNQGERGESAFSISSDGVGISRYAIRTSGPGFAVERDYEIETRSAALPRTTSRFVQIAAGQSRTIDLSADREPYINGSIDQVISASYLPGLNPQPLLASLYRYPYGCTEQTVSVAMPLLLSESVGTLPGMSPELRAAEIQGAVDKILTRQSADGSIGLWRQGDGDASPYLQLYASEFLLMAADADYRVPASAKIRTLEAVRRLSDLDMQSGLNLDYRFGLDTDRPDYEKRSAERAAYAQSVLARFDKVKKTDLIYLHDRFATRMDDSVALSHLGYALAAMGDERRSNQAFARALSRMTETAESYYNTPVRNAAAMVALGENLPETTLSVALSTLRVDNPAYLNTHEKAWVLRALAGQAGRGVPFEGDENWTANGSTAILNKVGENAALDISNPHDRPIYIQITTSGQPSEPEAATSNGIRIAKTLYAMDGDEIDANRIAQGERAIILLEATPRTSQSAMWVVADLLPAGFEIETILSGTDAGETGPFSWLGELDEMDVTEARDDRFIASWREEGRRSEASTRRVAYVVRAVTQGDFVFPGAFVEDMYRPDQSAATEAGRLQVTEAGAL